MALDYQRVFWSDFRGNTRWRLMSPLQKLAFFGLIASQHELGGALPSESALLRNLAEVPYEDWVAVWRSPLTDWFEPLDGGRIAEPKTRRLTLADLQSRAERRRGADLTNAKRWGSQSESLSDTVSESQSESPPSPSPSPSPAPTPTPKRASRGAAAPPWVEVLAQKHSTLGPAWAEACAEWAQARRENRHKPLGPKGWTDLLREWAPKGHQAFLDAVRHSGASGWQSVNPKPLERAPGRHEPTREEALSRYRDMGAA